MKDRHRRLSNGERHQIQQSGKKRATNTKPPNVRAPTAASQPSAATRRIPTRDNHGHQLHRHNSVQWNCRGFVKKRAVVQQHIVATPARKPDVLLLKKR
ncbi:hypothetical protein HPB48_002464 [Haemaphysalis longicornis]|uniref:Uncharacterized protein n=1 Tax=Haemaphysalis longicornis TaxID=44386 RepID=A0A9J6FUU0_HAELO|nr:hypothetical protein HPB48_002464 [Haemaphysalis longicornis]